MTDDEPLFTDAELDALDNEEEDDAGLDCGRWSNGRLDRFCTRAGTEFCDFECPYRDAEAVKC